MGHVFVYALCDPDTGDIRYVGKTTIGISRYYQHLSTYIVRKRQHLHLYRWIGTLQKSGKRPILRVLEEVASPALLDEVERRWISRLRHDGVELCNHTDGGEGGAGRIPWNKGLRMGQEFRNKMRLSKQGRTGKESNRSRHIAMRRGNDLTEYPSIKEASKAAGVPYWALLKHLRKRPVSDDLLLGWTAEYID